MFVFRINLKIQDKVSTDKKIEESMWAVLLAKGSGYGAYNDAKDKMVKCFMGNNASQQFR
jgi:hypothetical protein